MTDWIKDAGWLSELRRVGSAGTDEEFDALVRGLVAAAVSGCRRDQQERIERLESALERTRDNFVAAVRGTPVRDMAETLAEAAAALAGEVNPE